MKFPCIESMTKIVVGCFTIRVWREEQEVCESYPNLDIHEAASRTWSADERFASSARLVEAIASLPRINAIEILYTHSEQGVVVYVNWP